MTSLTPGCDPDMSTTGAPFGDPHQGLRLRSGLVLLAVAAACAFLATRSSVPGAIAVPAAVVGLLCALVLVRRGIRLAHRAGAGAASAVSRAAHRSRPIPTVAP